MDLCITQGRYTQPHRLINNSKDAVHLFGGMSWLNPRHRLLASLLLSLTRAPGLRPALGRASLCIALEENSPLYSVT